VGVVYYWPLWNEARRGALDTLRDGSARAEWAWAAEASDKRANRRRRRRRTVLECGQKERPRGGEPARAGARDGRHYEVTDGHLALIFSSFSFKLPLWGGYLMFVCELSHLPLAWICRRLAVCAPVAGGPGRARVCAGKERQRHHSKPGEKPQSKQRASLGACGKSKCLVRPAAGSATEGRRRRHRRLCRRGRRRACSVFVFAAATAS
jgi:hypothetical protein